MVLLSWAGRPRDVMGAVYQRGYLQGAISLCQERDPFNTPRAGSLPLAQGEVETGAAGMGGFA